MDRISHLYCKGTLSPNGFCSYSCSVQKSASDMPHVPPGDGVDLVRAGNKGLLIGHASQEQRQTIKRVSRIRLPMRGKLMTDMVFIVVGQSFRLKFTREHTGIDQWPMSGSEGVNLFGE